VSPQPYKPVYRVHVPDADVLAVMVSLGRSKPREIAAAVSSATGIAVDVPWMRKILHRLRADGLTEQTTRQGDETGRGKPSASSRWDLTDDGRLLAGGGM